MRRAAAALSALLASTFLSCTSSPPPRERPARRPVVTRDLIEVPPGKIPDLADDLAGETLVHVIEDDLRYLSRRREDESFRIGADACTVAELRRALEELRDGVLAGRPPGDLVRDRFRFYRSSGRRGGPLVTGYYEPVVAGSRERTGEFAYPLYRRPEDLIEVDLGEFVPELAGRKIHGRVLGSNLGPYYSRREIDEDGILANRGLELAWLDDPVTVFFLQVQGSAQLRLAGGGMMRVGFAASNGRRYMSIGRVLIEAGKLARGEASAPGIQRYLRTHPEEAGEAMFANERYVFFREVEDGPIGSLGVKLTPGRSVAADPGWYAPGSLLYLETGVPRIERGEFAGTRPVRRLVLVQDSGAAITGPGRLDLFFGSGEQAGLEAGYMSYGGELYALWPPCGDSP